jgi:eukaryotic-like serine/threonine-protein kinase
VKHSRRAIIASALALSMRSTVTARRATAAAQPITDTDDPGTAMFRGNPARTGANPGSGPTGTPKELWRFRAGYGQFVSSPALVGNLLYIGCTDGNLYAVDSGSGDEAWHAETGGPIISSPAVAGNALYVGSFGALFALDAATGASASQFRVEGPMQQQQQLLAGAAVDSSPAVVDGIAYVGSSDGNLYAFDVQTNAFQTFPTGSPVLSSPAVHEGIIYVGGYGLIYALRASDLSELGRFTVDGPVDTAVAVMNGKVYVATSKGRIYAFDVVPAGVEPGTWRPDGPLWSVQTGGQIFSSLAVVTVEDRSYVFAACGDSNLYAYDADTGESAWRVPQIPVFGPIASSPAVVPSDGILYVGSGDGKVHAIDIRTHQPREGWPISVGSRVDSSPVVLDGRLYVGSADGVIAIGDET